MTTDQKTKLIGPISIGIIMDGNRRWAKAKGVPYLEGHRTGYFKLKDVVRWANELGIKYVTAYAFSTENWNRTPEEVKYILDLFKWVLETEIASVKKDNICLRFIGDKKRFSENLQNLMDKAEKETASNTGPILLLCVSYGGRSELLEAVKGIVENREKITAEVMDKYVMTAGTPDPDMVIRTGGEMRLSGFLPWQSVYSELFFTKTLWPDLSEEEFKSLIEEFSKRKRNMGK